MKRRTFLHQATASGIMASQISHNLVHAQGDDTQSVDLSQLFAPLSGQVLSQAKKLGASFAEFRMGRNTSESIHTREKAVQGVNFSTDSGCCVRVLVDGAWGFAASHDISKNEVGKLTQTAIAIAKQQQGKRLHAVNLESLNAWRDQWQMPMQIDPFSVTLEEKADRLLHINNRALAAGAKFCRSGLVQVREEKWLANSAGSRIEQSRVRLRPYFSVTLLDEKKGGFASRDSLAAPRGSGYEYFKEYDFDSEVVQAVEEAKEKLAAPGVTAGLKDLVIHPTNLWLTIHESIGHPTELDRALGYEANFAGTSFVKPELLDKLQYASELVTVRADRTQANGLSTVAYDDDGVKTAGQEFNIIDKGRFTNYQMALGQASLIGREHSNGCAYADSFSSFPLQRMPNISLQPGADDSITADTLISDVEDGIYIVGSGSWSIDQQRYNFQFTGQTFHKIKNGKLDGMYKDVAYQGNSVEFWNACDGLAGPSTYELGGAFNCGKGRPTQSAPVSHGAVPARFRQIQVLNTQQEAGA
ncbi:MAG: TldD/PmbA family protein [Verrucomicrobiota bacterium]